MGALELEVGAARIAFTDRLDGVSRPPYDRANLGFATGDEPDAVADNRRRVAEHLGGAFADPGRWTGAHQVHGAGVTRVLSPEDGGAPADALVTTVAGLPLLVLVADCAPLALVAGDAIAAVHAGWRGLATGVVEAAVDAVRDGGRAPVRAVLGPCIHPAHYEFGVEALDVVSARLGSSVRGETGNGAPALDLRAAVRAALARVGVDDLDDVDLCTYESHDHFSHRRDGTTGRQGLLVVREL